MTLQICHLIALFTVMMFFQTANCADEALNPWIDAELVRNNAIMQLLVDDLNSYSDNPLNKIFKSKRKRDTLDSTPRRICGVKLVKAVIKVCDGCVKAPGMVKVEGKRSAGFGSDPRHTYQTLRKRDQSLTRMCCANPCTYDVIKENFCC